VTANYGLLLGCAVAASATLAYVLAVLAVRVAARGEVVGRRALRLRVAPGAAALLVSLGLSLPAFLLYEPDQTEAWPGATALALSGAGVALLCASLARGLGAWWRTARLAHGWRGCAEPLSLASPVPAFALDHPFPVVAVVGIARPRLFLARRVVAALAPEELEAVLAHEAAHISARDNLKRLALRFLPTAGWGRLAGALEQRWEAESEAAADRGAGPEAALDLASALVKVARLAPPGARLGLPVAAFHTGADGVAARVQALVRAPDEAALPSAEARPRAGLLLALLALAAAVAALPLVHRASEVLIHLP
jgi:Zn-dependent protease with chaperone function